MSKKEEKNRKKNKPADENIIKIRTLRFWFSCVVGLLLTVSAAITMVLFLLFELFGLFEIMGTGSIFLIVSLVVVCTAVGTVLAAVTSKYILKRISRIRDGMRQIAKGNFKVRVRESDNQRAPSEFGELERTFNQMASDLDGIEIFRNDFINNFSHEFKTPIVSIRGFARQLQSSNLSDEERREYLDIIVSESERLVNMSSNVLLLSKLENQQIVSDKTEFDLDEQIRRSILLLEKEWSEKDIELDISLDEISINFNEEMLSHLWINLISNAIKFTNRGGKIEISLTERDGAAIFSIKDNGIGMSDEIKERIFEKFYQGDTSHTASGNGIGLNIVQRIASLARGNIEVESKLGEGSKFTVTLPL